MTYKITRVDYELIPRYNISSMTGTLPVYYRVPVQSHLLPGATSAAFTAFANCQIDQLVQPLRGSFNPIAYSDNA